MVVLVTGANGQLGQSLQMIASDYDAIRFLFYTSKELDITRKEAVEDIFDTVRPDYCINTAAYTAVDKAESERSEAFLVNAEGVRNIASACKDYNCLLIHISTDFVFDGTKNSPYTETDAPNPKSVYGKSKLEGERIVQEILARYFIIRTSWIYSKFGHNFMKTMLRLADEKPELSIVNDQIGTPTNATDLAEAILTILLSEDQDSRQFGIYNFSNEGFCSWYEFAKKIFEINDKSTIVNPITTADYPAAAERPAYSVLDKTKIKEMFGLQIEDWALSLLRNSKKT